MFATLRNCALCVLLCSLVPAFSQDVEYLYPDVCPEITIQPNLNLTKYQGQWQDWRYSKDNSDYYKCSSHVYTAMRDGPNDMKFIIASKVLLNNNTVVREAGLFRATESSKPEGTALSLIDQHYHSAVFYILETDYDSYAVEYACYDNGGTKAEHVWIVIRGKELSEEKMEKALAALRRNNVEVEMVDVDGSCKEFYE